MRQPAVLLISPRRRPTLARNGAVWGCSMFRGSGTPRAGVPARECQSFRPGQLLLQCGEEAFGHDLLVAGAFAAHVGQHPGFSLRLLVGRRRLLTAPIGVKDQTGTRGGGLSGPCASRRARGAPPVCRASPIPHTGGS
jgi:hypothetical protein